MIILKQEDTDIVRVCHATTTTILTRGLGRVGGRVEVEGKRGDLGLSGFVPSFLAVTGFTQ